MMLRIESLTYGVDDLDAGKRYFADWGLTAVERGAAGADYLLPSGQQIALRASGDPSLPPPIEGGSTVREVTWGFASAVALAALGAAFGDRPLRHGSDGTLHATDPMGLALAFRVADVRATPAPAPAGPRLNAPFAVGDRIAPARIGHAVFNVPRAVAAETVAFYTGVLGFRLSDSVTNFGDFMRCAGSRDHHNLFLLQQDGAAFNHAAFEVQNFDEVIVGGKTMERAGWKAATTPGRHNLGSNLFWYFDNPSGGKTEYFADMDLMDDDWQTRVWEKNPGFARWMV